MKAHDLARELLKLPEDTVVVKFRDEGGYNECFFLEGTHRIHPDARKHDPAYLKDSRAKFVKGIGKADYVTAPVDSRAKLIPFVVIY